MLDSLGSLLLDLLVSLGAVGGGGEYKSACRSSIWQTPQDCVGPPFLHLSARLASRARRDVLEGVRHHGVAARDDALDHLEHPRLRLCASYYFIMFKYRNHRYIDTTNQILLLC